MKLNDIVQMLRNHGPVIIGVGILLTPILWTIFSVTHEERIDTLHERISLLEENLSYAETKLKSPAEFVKRNEQSPFSSSSVDNGEPLKPLSTKTYSYPPVQNPNKLTKSEVRDIVNFYGLFTEWKVNPQLRFLDSDVSYWFEKGLSETILKKQFEARRIVLDRAEKSGVKYPTQGDLSHAAEQILSTLSD
jgi:hypothetical protein